MSRDIFKSLPIELHKKNIKKIVHLAGVTVTPRFLPPPPPMAPYLYEGWGGG